MLGNANTSDDEAALLRVIDHARQLNTMIDIARLERMRFIYRSWIASAASIEGGFSLTRDELDCILEFPAQRSHLDFLMATFRTNEPGDIDERIDLLTMLVACTCLARGSLEAKAKMLFTLVDIDTKDEIVEDELAMIIALCSDGLRCLNIVVTELVDLDARAMACEAFEFVDVDEGGKMSFTLFVQWLVAHWRPAALLDRIQSLFLLSRIAQRLHDVLQHLTQERESSLFHRYSVAHFEGDLKAENVTVVVGPIVGPVSSSDIRILVEVDRSTTVQIFAFQVGTTSRSHERDQQFTIAFEAWAPQVVVIGGLVAGKTYQIRLLGVCKRDRERCIAIATTHRQDMDATAIDGGTLWEMHALNHDGIGQTTQVYERLKHERLKAAEAKTALLTVHFSAIRLDGSSLNTMINLMCEDSDANIEKVRSLLRQSVRDSLNRSELFDILRIGSNLLFSSVHDLMPMTEAAMDSSWTIDSSHIADLVRLVRDSWSLYVGMLWGIEADDGITMIDEGGCTMLLKYDEQHDKASQSLAKLLPTIDSTQDLVIVTTEPILPLCFGESSITTKGYEGRDDTRAETILKEAMPLVEWKRASLARNVCLVSRHPTAGFQARFHIKNTTISIAQAVCGPTSGSTRFADMPAKVTSIDLVGAVLSTEAPIVAPHCVTVRRSVGESSSRPSSQVRSSRPTNRSMLRSSHGDAAVLPTRLRSEICLLHEGAGIRVLVGPIVGMASARNARLILECDQEGWVNVCLTDSFTKETHLTRLHVRRYRPATCVSNGLRPGRSYRVSLAGVRNAVSGFVQTPRCEPASVRMLLLADDAFCDLSTTVRRDFSPGSVSSHMGNVRERCIDEASISGSSVMYDMAIHVGSIAALRKDLLRGHEMLRQHITDSSSCFAYARLQDMVRVCYRAYTAIPDVGLLRATGPNWFPGLGIVRSLVQKETPIQLLHAVSEVIREYEHSAAVLDRHESGLACKLADRIFAATLDTTDCLFGSSNAQFVEWPERLLTTRQRSALCHVLYDRERSFLLPSSSISKQVLIFCDAPIVWPYTTDTAPRFESQLDKIIAIASDPWAAYPHDLCDLLDMLFDAITKDPMLRITCVCSGALFASRVVISHKQSGRSIEQLSLGTISNIDRQRPTVIHYTPERMQSSLGDGYTVTAHAVGGTSTSLKQYCMLNVVPHAQGAVCTHAFYTAGRPEATLVLGPVIGRVTTRTARILIEVDRPVSTVTCVFSATTSSHSVSADAEVQAFVPTVFKFEGLHPGTRYKVKFEGLMTGPEDIDVYVETPALMPLSVEWLVLSRNNLRHFLPTPDSGDRSDSHWNRILSSGTRSYNTQTASIAANRNGDSLGESLDQQSEQFNPWYHVEAFALSEPLRHPQFSVHIGGQVDLSTAFTAEELCQLVAQLSDATTSETTKNEVYATARFRLQEVYRNTWGVESMRTTLSYASNVMLLHDAADLFFSTTRMQELIRQHVLVNDAYNAPADEHLSHVANRLRAMAFELWQLYQNQLSVDVNESDLDNSRRSSSKFASYLTLGMCRLAFANVSDELRDLCSNSPIVEQENARPKTTPTVQPVVPLTLPTGNEEIVQLALFSSATWKIVDEALDIAVAEAGSGAPKATRTKPQGNASVKQLVLFLPVDFIEIVATYPAIRPEVVRLLEKLFQWKLVARAERNVSLICASERSSSISFTVIDEKVNESMVLTRVASISKPHDASITKSGAQAKNKSVKNAATTIKGYFSERFTYHSTPMPTSNSVEGSQCRSYANYTFLSDYRRGILNESLLYFPLKALPTIVLGPVVGRMVRSEQTVPVNDSDNPAQVVFFNVPILVELNSPARLTCVVVDSMINSEMRVTRELLADQPAVFCIRGLVPLRRYVYFFEDVANGNSRRGCFHTPPSESTSLNLVAVSSNFSTHMDEEQDSLWIPLLERAKLPWCGIDAVLHLGGQVPLHEAAVECFEWTHRELAREILHGERNEVELKRVSHIRTRIRRRFQQEYRICWNLPHIRELLAYASHWFLHSKVDVAPFYGREALGSVDTSRATALVVETAKEVVRAYQIQLMTAIDDDDRAEAICIAATLPHSEEESKPVKTPSSDSAAPSPIPFVPEGSPVEVKDEQQIANEQSEPVEELPGRAADEILDAGGALYWQHGDIAVFMSDIRSTSSSVASSDTEPEPITCNGRLSRPLSLQENPMMSEAQWRYFESVLRKKRTLLLVLCIELPLILTNATHVEKLREDLPPTSSPWKLYDHNHVLQHWVACKRQLEQLLLLLFKWKAKRSGRDILVLSGGMRVGIDTMLFDRETKLSIRNLTVGPVTASVETFEFPLRGVACATFGGGIKDDHFTFQHNLLAKNNYLLLTVSNEPLAETKTSSVIVDFVANEPVVLSRLHPIDKFQRFPLWWTTYVPMGHAVFWDDTITLKSETDERVLALRAYIWHDPGFAGALEVFYEQYNFAETARMADLRSRHLQHVDLQANFLSVLADLWRAIPESKRHSMAYFLDPFVRDMLLTHVAPELWTTRLPSGEPIELAFFSRVLREFVFDSCLLRLTIATQQDDETIAYRQDMEKRTRDAEKAVHEKEKADQTAAQEVERMAELLRTDPLQYATIKLAQQEAEKRVKLARHEEKLAHKKAARLAELEEEQAIAKEQKKLHKLAERDVVAYERRQRELDMRIRKLEETRAQRAAQKKAAAEKAVKATMVDQ